MSDEYVNRMRFDNLSRLRDAVHDIVSNLGETNVISVERITERLAKKGIYIDVDLLRMIIERWDKKSDYSIFKRYDSSWLEINNTGMIKNAIYGQKPILAKHRRRIEEEEKEEKKKNKEGKVEVLYTHDTETGQFKRNITSKGVLHNKVWVEAQTIGDKYIPAHYEPSPYYAITDEVILGTWVLDAKSDRVKEIREYVFNLEPTFTYAAYWEEMIKKGKELKLNAHKDYLKFSPLEIIIKMNKRRASS